MIDNIIHQNQSNFTTLNTFLTMLHGYIEMVEAGENYTGMSSPEVLKVYNEFKIITGGKKHYYESYLQRKTGSDDDDYYYKLNGKYFLKEPLVQGISIEELKDYKNRIVEALNLNEHLNDEYIESINNVLESQNPNECYDFILNQFENKEVSNFGQLFEILSFSILKVYFEAFGFNLKRFSVSYSNDGGMDFISYAGIYQVTAASGKKKAEDDLAKLPGIKRVIVLNECPVNLLKVYQADQNITEIITTADLKYHFLKWLKDKNTTNKQHLINVLDVFCNEWKREIGMS